MYIVMYVCGYTCFKYASHHSGQGSREEYHQNSTPGTPMPGSEAIAFSSLAEASSPATPRELLFTNNAAITISMAAGVCVCVL